MVKIESSLLNVEEENVIQTIYNLEVAGTNYFHIDVMDGKFVKNNTIEKMRKYTEYIKNVSNIPIDVHLMVENAKDQINDYLDIGVDCIIFHLESCKNENETLKLISFIKNSNTKVGISIKPNTRIEDIYGYLPYIHKVLIMTVEPGEGGQKLMPEVIEKIRKLNIYSYENNYDIDIAVDGGINENTVKEITDAGANIVVAGSYIINSEDYKKAILKLKN